MAKQIDERTGCDDDERKSHQCEHVTPSHLGIVRRDIIDKPSRPDPRIAAEEIILYTDGPMKSSRKSGSQKTAYKVNQEIVYPLQGVGKITSIEEKPFKDEMLLYYIVYLEVSDMTVMIPVEKAEEIGIRAIVNKAESNKALKLLTEDYEPVSTDWKMRYQMNLDLLKSGSVMDIATVVRTLYHRSKIKELPILERKLFDNALKLAVDEISFSLGKSKDEVEALIFSKLETE